MKNDTINFLEIQGYKVIHIKENNNKELIIRVKKKLKKSICPNCGTIRKISTHANDEVRS